MSPLQPFLVSTSIAIESWDEYLLGCDLGPRMGEESRFALYNTKVLLAYSILLCRSVNPNLMYDVGSAIHRNQISKLPTIGIIEC